MAPNECPSLCGLGAMDGCVPFLILCGTAPGRELAVLAEGSNEPPSRHIASEKKHTGLLEEVPSDERVDIRITYDKFGFRCWDGQALEQVAQGGHGCRGCGQAQSMSR